MLNAAYADGLLSEHTLAQRLELLFESRLIDPSLLVGDLTRRSRSRDWLTKVAGTITQGIRELVAAPEEKAIERPTLLALDWTGEQQELFVGRHPSCDLVLTRPAVSRLHARLMFRNGGWIVQDLESTNGTFVNYVRVGRRQLRPGDHIVFGDQHVRID
jgi:hypothetical protein